MVHVPVPDKLTQNTCCVLMFSGGRDSTLAALRLLDAGIVPTLVTVTSDHLYGIETVRRRLSELKDLLPGFVRWMHIRQPINLATDTSFYEQTCLSCHHAYVVVAASIAASLGARALAFGYTSYQSDWPEQTPLAIASLTNILADHGIRLLLPAHDLASKEATQDELAWRGLSTASLEQKCIRQITNVALDGDRLRSQISLWETAIRASMQMLDTIPAGVIADIALEELGR